MTVMTLIVDDLREALAADFATARLELVEARRRRREKDTPENRSLVASCQTQLDRLLDMYLDMVRGA
jgi:hypothetical protein